MKELELCHMDDILLKCCKINHCSCEPRATWVTPFYFSHGHISIRPVFHPSPESAFCYFQELWRSQAADDACNHVLLQVNYYFLKACDLEDSESLRMWNSATRSAQMTQIIFSYISKCHLSKSVLTKVCGPC